MTRSSLPLSCFLLTTQGDEASTFGDLWRRAIGAHRGQRVEVEFWPIATIVNELGFAIDSGLFRPSHSGVASASPVDAIDAGASRCFSSECTAHVALLLSIGVRAAEKGSAPEAVVTERGGRKGGGGRLDGFVRVPLPMLRKRFREGAALVAVRRGEQALITVSFVCRPDTPCSAFVVRVAPAVRVVNRTSEAVVLRSTQPRAEGGGLGGPLQPHARIEAFGAAGLPWAHVTLHSPNAALSACRVGALGAQLALASAGGDRWSAVFGEEGGAVDGEFLLCTVTFSSSNPAHNLTRPPTIFDRPDAREYACVVGPFDATLGRALCWVEYVSTAPLAAPVRDEAGGAGVATVFAPRGDATAAATQLYVRSSHAEPSTSCAALASVRVLCRGDRERAVAAAGAATARAAAADDGGAPPPPALRSTVIEVLPSLVLCNATPFALSIQTALGIRRLKPLHEACSDGAARDAMCDAFTGIPAEGTASRARISCDAERTWSDTFQVAPSTKRHRLLCPMQAAAARGDDGARRAAGAEAMGSTALLTFTTIKEGPTPYVVVFCDSQPPLMVDNASSYALECGASDVHVAAEGGSGGGGGGVRGANAVVPFLAVAPGTQSEFDWAFSATSHSRGSTPAGATMLPGAWAGEAVLGKRKEKLKSLGLTAALVGCRLRFRCKLPNAERATTWSGRISCTPGHQRVAFLASPGGRSPAAELKLHVFCHAGTWILQLSDVDRTPQLRPPLVLLPRSAGAAVAGAGAGARAGSAAAAPLSAAGRNGGSCDATREAILAAHFRFRLCIPEVSVSLYRERGEENSGARGGAAAKATSAAAYNAARRLVARRASTWSGRLQNVQRILREREERAPQLGREIAHVKLRGVRLCVEHPVSQQPQPQPQAGDKGAKCGAGGAASASGRPASRRGDCDDVVYCRVPAPAAAANVEALIDGMRVDSASSAAAKAKSPYWSVWQIVGAVSSCQVDGFTEQRASGTASPVLFRGPLRERPGGRRRTASAAAAAPSSATRAAHGEGTRDALRVVVVTASPRRDAVSVRTPRAAFVETAAVQLAPCVVVVDDQIANELIVALRDIFAAASLGAPPLGEEDGAAADAAGGGDGAAHTLRAIAAKAAASRTYIGSLYIAPLRVTLTLCIAAPLALSLERVPLSFSDVHLRRIFAAPRRIAEELAANFIADAILMSPALFGSLQVLGNPVSLIRAFAAGVGELVAAPLHAARTGKGILGVAGALAGGGRYLASRTLGGILTSFAGMTTALARNVDRLSFDGDHISRRETLRQRQRHSELLCLTPATAGNGEFDSVYVIHMRTLLTI